MGGQYVHTARVQRIVFHPRFPVDIRHNAKIGREALARWVAKKTLNKPRFPSLRA
jgi:predicted signal transduction protein with EAL and GGDEF domain